MVRMSLSPGVKVTNRRPKPTMQWEATRRVAFDADEDEDMPSDQPESRHRLQVKPFSIPKPICQEKHQQVDAKNDEHSSFATKRLEDVKSPSSALSSQGTRQTASFQGARSSKRVVDTMRESEPNTTDEGSKDVRDEWITCGPDRSSKWYQGIFGTWIHQSDGSWCFKHARSQPRGSIHYGQKKKHKPRITFQTLPPEIRNAIYNLVIPECSVLVVRDRPQKEAQLQTKMWSEERISCRQSRSRLRHQLDPSQDPASFNDAINLLRTCKIIRGEAETYLYSSTFFHFFTLKDLRKFLSVASKAGIESIRRVSIRQDGYGNPEMTSHQEYQRRYYQGWEMTSARFGEMTPNLQHLKLVVYDREWPCVLSGKDFNPAWSDSILKTAPTLLPKVEVRIRHRMIHQNREVLRDLERRVEDGMMTRAGRDVRDREETEAVMRQIAARRAMKADRERKRKAKLCAPPPPTELVISMDDVERNAGKSVAMSKVRSKGLDKFHKINLATKNVDRLE